VVFGEGNINNPVLMIIGEVPDKTDDAEKRPFRGKCGEKLDEILKYIGLTREDVYITNGVLCSPPNRRTPLICEILKCRSRLLEQIKIINPQMIVIMGRVAMQALIGKQVVGPLSKYFDIRFRNMTIDGNPCKYVITYHTSYLLRDRKSAYPYMIQHWTDIKNELNKN
jgi:DNA polymerase